MGRLLNRIRQQQEGITGLETAIILIAFVIVASVFAYVVLSAGLFPLQKAKDAVHAGLESTMSTVQLKGSVLAKMENSVVKEIYLFLGIPAAGHPVDFTGTSENATANTTSNVVVISYADTTHLIPSANWTMEKLSTMNTDNLLDTNELFIVTVDLSNSSDNISIGPYERFTLEIKPPSGPVLTIERTVPGRVSQYINLH
ncbi:archaellin/type IV pilin N-terminal domain-containing protein [Chloroflexota bacterium]